MQQPSLSPANQTPANQTKPKLTWHKPTIVFMPLQVTANGSGTTEDANGSSTIG